MAMAGRIRTASITGLLNRVVSSDPLSAGGSAVQRALLVPNFVRSERNYAAEPPAPPAKEIKVKVPLNLYGGSANYATALYTASVKTNALETVESEIFTFVEAMKKATVFSLFTRDTSVPKDTRVKVMIDISTHAKFSDITKNFLVLVAENGRLQYLETIAKKFSELLKAHKGEVDVTVTTVIPLPPQEEKELREILQERLGKDKKILLEQKIDKRILGGITVEYQQKLFDMSIRNKAKQMERLLREPIDFDNL